ncbi:MAG: FAD:protein FMN transferase [Puniceicoccales bacterium]|jgi:thiamine biosynthesis lipoprotein|nr:FAD:protein FMN transferase [Puniceicoccales bacterium]
MSDEEKKSLRFGHEAMHTLFTLFIANEPETADYASSAAQAAFDALDRIESFLSRFEPSSDISKVNALEKGASYSLGEEAWDCLMVAAQVAAETGRAFDPAAGALVDFWKSKAGFPPFAWEETDEWKAAWEQHRIGEFALDPESRELLCVAPGSKLDLGAIGKGFALDEMAKVLECDWGISRALLSAGGSTVLALDAPPDKPGWKIGFGGETRLPLAVLVRRALSSSGTHNQPTHLVDPRTGRLVVRKDLVRSLAPTGAVADALSTAFFVMSREELDACCTAHPEYIALLTKGDDVPDAFEIIGQHDALPWEQRTL